MWDNQKVSSLCQTKRSKEGLVVWEGGDQRKDRLCEGGDQNGVRKNVRVQQKIVCTS